MVDHFVTVHRPGSHEARQADCLTPLVDPCPTEIHLVRRLARKGIHLKDYDHRAQGDERYLVTEWRRR